MKKNLRWLKFIIMLIIIGIVVKIINNYFEHLNVILHNIFLYLLLASLLCIFLGVINPKRFVLFKKKSRVTGGLGYALIAIVFFILFGMTL
ncbi:hypothetical protein PJ311_14175 [Bacillus sp. CLL-7-23]|uniref:AI-2E family transporter n=1 Tax=Bacillus changyiensis TaxID=3004103 RepID=A0ABT4X6B5_9BACI|nr:hypothetical protein [Bacillus changyiensis]MDA7027730.1 hypothetical protein [Bacillus changyiensis]